MDFIKNGAKIKRKYHLDDFSVRSDIIFPYGSLVCFRLRFEDFEALSFQVSIVTHISSSFVSSILVYLE